MIYFNKMENKIIQIINSKSLNYHNNKENNYKSLNYHNTNKKQVKELMEIQ